MSGNNLHTGTVSISGTATRDQVLTVTNNIADADGLGTFAYQWKRSGTAISGATSTTYTLVSADVGNTITVTITYTDGKGNIESETSAATAAVIIPPQFPTIGSGNATVGYWVGDVSSNKLIVAPEQMSKYGAYWGSSGTVRGVVSTSNGLGNTNTLYAFGSAAHGAAYYCKTLTIGGYNTWYMPAKDELLTIYSNKSALGSINPIMGNGTIPYLSSTEYNATLVHALRYGVGAFGFYGKSGSNGGYTRAVRRTAAN